jgi:hypothetical protein
MKRTRTRYRLSRSATRCLLALGQMAGHPPLPVQNKQLAAYLGVTSAWRAVRALSAVGLAERPGMYGAGILLTADGVACYRLMLLQKTPSLRRKIVSEYLEALGGKGAREEEDGAQGVRG